MRTLRALSVVLALIGAGVGARGQEPPPMDEEEPRRLIETVRIWRMTQELDLSEEQILQFFPKLKNLEDMERHRAETKAKVIRELDELLKADKPSLPALQKKMAEVERVDEEFDKKAAKVKDEIKSVLSVEQQAKLLVFRFKFQREMRDIIREIRGHPRRHSGPEE